MAQQPGSIERMFESATLTLQPESDAPGDAFSPPGADHGEVFTRRWVVEFILDLVGYTADRDLGAMTLVEPSCGTGAFLTSIVDRLVESAVRHGRPLSSLGPAIRAYEVLEANAERARKVVVERLRDAGLSQVEAEKVVAQWVTTADFLLHGQPASTADFVVGNPPYIRLESVSPSSMRAYRANFRTMRGRSDIYVGFIEQGLRLLRPDGVLGVICADRWMRNQYGASLRELVTSSYAVDAVIAMHGVDAFEDEVAAYPAVVVLRNGPPTGTTAVEAQPSFGQEDAAELLRWQRRRRGGVARRSSYEAARLGQWFDGKDLWPSGSAARLATLAALERRFPPLQDAATGTRVGIGVASGCDDVFITTDPDLVEADRLLPLLRSADTRTGQPVWSGGYLVNPWDSAGLVSLDDYPLLRRHLESHRERLAARHVGRRTPAQWFRTIDRVDPALTARPKLVLPDLKAAAHPVLDEGDYYPHHNLYHVTSAGWDLEVLGGLLLSEVANLFVGSYCVKMQGGCYRFQAQYLRRIRVPNLAQVKRQDARALARAFADRDVEAATAVALRLYALDELP